MKKIYLGQDKDGEKVELDFDQEGINFILLAGGTGSGKSIFHNNLYKELTEKYSPDEIGFVFLDMTRTDFHHGPSPYLLKPVVNDPTEAIQTLHDVVDLKTDKIVFVHIEECDMVFTDRQRLDRAFEKLKDQKNIHVIYSTSRIDQDYLADWLKNYIDFRVVFNVATREDSNFLLGNDTAYFFKSAGERVLAYNGRQIHCQPFSDEEAKPLKDTFKF